MKHMLLSIIFFSQKSFCEENSINKKEDIKIENIDVTNSVSLRIENDKNDTYSFSDHGKPDPFIPILNQKKKEIVKDEAEGLQKYFLTDLKMIGSLKKTRENRRKSVILMPDGTTSIVNIGDKIGRNNGVIMNIEEKKIIIKEEHKKDGKDGDEIDYLDSEIIMSEDDYKPSEKKEKKTKTLNNIPNQMMDETKKDKT